MPKGHPMFLAVPHDRQIQKTEMAASSIMHIFRGVFSLVSCRWYSGERDRARRYAGENPSQCAG